MEMYTSLTTRIITNGYAQSATSGRVYYCHLHGTLYAVSRVLRTYKLTDLHEYESGCLMMILLKNALVT